MAEQVEDGGTADHCSILTDLGVQIKPHLSSSAGGHVLAKHLADDQIPHALGHQGKLGSCCRECDRQDGVWYGRQHMGVLVALLFSGLALLLSLCSLVYLLKVGTGTVSTSDVEDLKQKVLRLETLCGATPGWPAAPPGVSADSSGPKSYESPWEQNANYPPSAVSAANELDWQSVENGHITTDSYDDETNDEDGGSPYDSFFAHSRQKRSTKRKRRGNGKSKQCKKVENCVKAKEKSKKLSRKCQRIIQCVPPQTVVPNAVHFMSDVGKHERQKKFSKVAPTNDVALTYAEAPLHLSEAADWMALVYKDQAQQPIVALKNGGYNVTKSGLYLIYTSVMFHDLKPRQSLAVVVNGERRFKCMESVDYPQGPQKYKTCGITGVTFLNANERLEVQILYAQTEIDLSTDTTYFGAVLLTPFGS